MKILFLLFLQCVSVLCLANKIVVADVKSLSSANATAQPGDTIIMQNGIWKNITIVLNCKGNSIKPIVVKAETEGKVIISGNSQLRIGGEYIVIDGLYFHNGNAGNNPIINFCIDKNTVANHCRVTNIVINDFNNLKRLDENYWIALYGKNNRIDHSTFLNKKNLGVLLAVILEDEKSRNNFHLIDHNYFGKRPPLASNTGEIIRVGVSQHCEFNSNTQITNNVFEDCDGETEIISIKSCHNVIRNNLFKTCQGSVVLRHGNYNIVEHNLFLGNDKEGTGGVRIINKGQWVVNNLFYKCRGEGFRSTISIMNGVPNSPAFRYVPVEDAMICNNSFVECAPLAFCDGSDSERSVIPKNVQFRNNIFYNTKDSFLYKSFDEISGIAFSGNLINNNLKQIVNEGFIKSKMPLEKMGQLYLPKAAVQNTFSIDQTVLDSAHKRSASKLSSTPGAKVNNELLFLHANDRTKTGAKWFNSKFEDLPKQTIEFTCKTAVEVSSAIEKNKEKQLIIFLTDSQYVFEKPLPIVGNVTFKSSNKKAIKFTYDIASDYLFYIESGSSFSLKNLSLDFSNVKCKTVVSSDTSGNVNHSKFSADNCRFANNNQIFLRAAKSSVFDSIIVSKCSFLKGNRMLFSLHEENDKKGYYNVEHLIITGNIFNNNVGQLLSLLRSGNDESTMGPSLIFANNNISNAIAGENNLPFIHLIGVQRSIIENNIFTNCYETKTIIEYKDFVRASHLLQNNLFKKSGNIENNKFVTSKNNHFD